MSSNHVPGAVPQAEQHQDEVPLGAVSLGAVPVGSAPPLESAAMVRDVDAAQAAAVIQSAVESLAPPPPAPAPPRPRDNTTDADRAAVRATFEDLAALHVSPVRHLMLEVRWGEAPTRFISLARPALQSLQSMAGALELEDLVNAIAGFDAALAAALATGQDRITGDAREALLGAYFPLQSGFASAFGLEGGKDRREPIVVDALLDGLEGVNQAVLDQLSLVGLGRLEPLLKARAEEIAVVSSIPRTVAQRIADRVKERVQAAPRGLATQSKGPRPSSRKPEGGEPRTVLEWLTQQLLREQTLMRLRRGEQVERADLRGADLAGAVFRGMDLRRAQLADANLVGADLWGADLESADLSGARLDRANLMGANLSRATLTGADLTGANLRGARLSFATLTSANLTGATLRDAVVKHADLEGASLRHVSGAGANFSGAHLRRAVLEDGDFARARMDDTALESARAARASFADTTFAGASLRGTDFSGADLRTADLRRATLDGAQFSGALVTALYPSGTPATGLRIDCLVTGDLRPGDELPQSAVAEHLAAVFTGIAGGAPAVASNSCSVARVDHLTRKQMLFADGAQVVLHGLLEECLLQLGPGTDLVIAADAALIDCRILGGRHITIEGAALDGPTTAMPFVEPRAITVTSTGVLAGQIQQPPGGTCFAFQRGSRLRLQIIDSARQS